MFRYGIVESICSYQTCLCGLFFLLQLPNALIGESTVLPQLPDPKDIYSIIDGQHREPILPIPKDIRPTLAKYRLGYN